MMVVMESFGWKVSDKSRQDRWTRVKIGQAKGFGSFLLDGDAITLKGAAQAGDYKVGFGACSGRILPASVK